MWGEVIFIFERTDKAKASEEPHLQARALLGVESFQPRMGTAAGTRGR